MTIKKELLGAGLEGLFNLLEKYLNLFGGTRPYSCQCCWRGGGFILFIREMSIFLAEPAPTVVNAVGEGAGLSVVIATGTEWKEAISGVSRDCFGGLKFNS